MAEAAFQHGSPLMVDYTPGSAVAAGQVVVINDKPSIAHNAIAANVKGALAAKGGVYKLPKTAGSGEAIAGNTKVYWDDTNNVATTSASGNKGIGWTTPDGSADDDTTVEVVHEPFS